MSRRVAPTALRIPISRVRSVTDTNMMFMIPIPPTRSETAAMPPRSRVIVRATPSKVAMMSAWLRMVKSLSSPAVTRWRVRSSVSTSSWAAVISWGVRTFT